MNKRIGIVGQGFVGNSIKQGLIKDYPDLLTFDLKKELSMCNSLYDLVINTDIIFVCVPTPMKSTGECYTGLAEKVIKDICSIEDGVKRVLILKTTVPPGTTMGFQKKYKEVDFVFNPEFLTEANAVNDFKNQNRIILGGINNTVMNIVTDLYRKTFPIIPIVHMTFDEAEMVKYVTNTFLATKVIYANEIYQICQGLNIDYDRVINAARLDPRLGNSHWSVPGPDGDFGFGGHCFPKDTNALKFAANKRGVNTELLNAVLEKNNKIRKKKEWEEQKGRSVI